MLNEAKYFSNHKFLLFVGFFLALILILIFSQFGSAQTLTSDQTGSEIIFSALNNTSDASNSVLRSDATSAVKYGPWGCRFTIQPINFKCEKEIIPPPPPKILKEQEIILEFLKIKQSEIIEREKILARKEQDLANLEQRVEQKIDQIALVNVEIAKARKQMADEDTANLAKLVSYYEKIPAENAAKFFDTMDQKTATMILTRMNARKVAAILTELTPKKASTLTEEIAKIKKNREEFLNLPNYGKK